MHQLRDFPNQVPLSLAQQASAATTGTTAGSSVDLIQSDGMCLAIRTVGAGVTGNTPLCTTKIQESSDGTTWTDVQKYSIGTNTSSQTVSFSTATMTDGMVEAISFIRTQRYVRPYNTITGTGTLAIPLTVLIGQQVKTL